jgi:hypothetical protein
MVLYNSGSQRQPQTAWQARAAQLLEEVAGDEEGGYYDGTEESWEMDMPGDGNPQL